MADFLWLCHCSFWPESIKRKDFEIQDPEEGFWKWGRFGENSSIWQFVYLQISFFGFKLCKDWAFVQHKTNIIEFKAYSSLILWNSHSQKWGRFPYDRFGSEAGWRVLWTLPPTMLQTNGPKTLQNQGGSLGEKIFVQKSSQFFTRVGLKNPTKNQK